METKSSITISQKQQVNNIKVNSRARLPMTTYCFWASSLTIPFRIVDLLNFGIIYTKTKNQTKITRCQLLDMFSLLADKVFPNISWLICLCFYPFLQPSVRPSITQKLLFCFTNFLHKKLKFKI